MNNCDIIYIILYHDSFTLLIVIFVQECHLKPLSGSNIPETWIYINN